MSCARKTSRTKRDQEIGSGQVPVDVVLEEAATNVPKRARQGAAVVPQEADITGVLWSSTTGKDEEMQPTTSGKRPMEPRGDNDMVCGLEVCDGPNEGR